MQRLQFYYINAQNNRNYKRYLFLYTDKLFWYSDSDPPKNISKSFYFNIDDKLTYDQFNKDFGPLSLGKTWKYVTQLQKLLAHPQCKNLKIYHHTSSHPQKMANAAFLMGAFQVISLGMTAKEAYRPFQKLELKPFKDAGYQQSTYKCTLLDCLNGIEYAIKIGWFDYKTFNFPEYEHYQKLQNGYLNWIIPNKIIAFSSPADKQFDRFGNRLFTPNDYIPIFKKLGVTVVVRLSNKTYQANEFVKKGIKHEEMFFPDNTNPQRQLVRRFLELVQKEKGAVAVHCKAGLGRTGTIIACYAIKHYYFPAAAFIAWIRIVRPGSIIGSQQNWLLQVEKQLREQGESSSIWAEIRETIDQKQILTTMRKLSINEKIEKDSENVDNEENGQEATWSNKLKRKLTGKFPRKESVNSKSSETLLKTSKMGYKK